MNKLKLAFFGAPSFAATVLQQIIDDTDLPVELKFVVTQPDRKAGRDQILTPTPVKLLAQKYNIPIIDDLKLKILNLKLQEIDLVLLYAFGEMISSEMLTMPRWGFWNIHPSLLPRFRGPSPITYPLLLGEKQTGVSLIQMDSRMDHGEIIAQEEYSIQNEDTQEKMRERLSSVGYKLFKQSVQLLLDGTLQKKEQEHSKATFTRLLTKQDGFVPYTTVHKIMRFEPLSEDEIPSIIQEYYKKYPPVTTSHLPPTTYYNLFRALSPWPGLWTLLPNGKRLKITKVELSGGKPTITHVQLEGKKEVDIKTFLSAYSYDLRGSTS